MLFGQVGGQSSFALYLEAIKSFNQGNLELAERQFSEVSVKDPANDAANYYLAKIYAKQNNPVKAREAALAAIAKDSSNLWYKIMLAEIYKIEGNTAEAIKVMDRLRVENPMRSELYDGLIELYIQEKEFAKAEEVLKDIEKNIGVNEGTALTRFNLMIFDGKQEQAHKYLEEFDSGFGTPRTATILGDNYAMQREDSIAEVFYLKALAIEPTYVPASFGLAEVYRVRGQYNLYFERMNPFLLDTDVNPRMKIDYMRQILTNTRFVQTFLPQVDTMMQNLYFAHPGDSAIAFTHSLFLVQVGRSGQALEVLHDNLINYPANREAHRQYLSLIYYLAMWEPMEVKSREALEIFKNDTDFMQFKGIAQLQRGNRAEAIKSFKEILKYSKGDSTTTVNTLTTIGDLTYQEGNKKEAFKYYQKTIKMEPRHLPALNNYAYFLSLEGKNLKKAERMSKVTIEEEPDNATYLDTYAWILHKMGKHAEAKTVLKRAMVYGGKENADILDHYADV
ncbi:MAG: tetratricopeptide repeat protein, partial [Bacteroidales bacterium]|nr:tetratricopeptide repeat protein [Bacteroidales bacterium]